MVIKLSFQSWGAIRWSQVERTVKSYRNEIFLATKSGDFDRVRFLQRRVLSSNSVLLWAIRRITLLNQGKKTSGVDKLIYASKEKRWALFKLISRKGIRAFKPLPVKRVYILKANGSLRPLGIPVIIDRVIQSLTAVALEPEWEAQFEHGSYGFRPARSCHDAMIRVYKTLNKKRKLFVLEGDIKGCFDNISHEALLFRLQNFPGCDLVAGWLKAGYMEEGSYIDTSVGTPQGGAISPLLANIALHGMESALGITYHKDGYVRSECPYTLVRYADDFLVLTTSLDLAEKAKEILSSYLLNMGLVLSPEKTSVTDSRYGFNFLGWNFRLFPDKRKPSGLITLVRPSVRSVEKVKEKLKVIWRSLVGNPIGSKIRNLNSVIIGWANYHRFVDASEVLRSLDHFNFLQAIRFARRQHSNKSWKWIVRRYFKTVDKDRWVFFDVTHGYVLKKFRTYKILNFIPVKFGMHPDNPACDSYFEGRKRDNLFRKFNTNKSMLRMFESQGTLCAVCGESLASDEGQLHIHHLIPRSHGGLDVYHNLMVLHDVCHRHAHSAKLSREVLISRLTEFVAKSEFPKPVLSKVRWGSSRSPFYCASRLNAGAGIKPSGVKNNEIVKLTDSSI